MRFFIGKLGLIKLSQSKDWVVVRGRGFLKGKYPLLGLIKDLTEAHGMNPGSD